MIIIILSVASCRELKMSTSGFPDCPILEMVAPKKMENTTRPNTFIPPVDTTVGASVIYVIKLSLSEKKVQNVI